MGIEFFGTLATVYKGGPMLITAEQNFLISQSLSKEGHRAVFIFQKTENRFFRMVKDKQKKQAEDKNSLFKKYTVKNDQYILNNVEQILLIISEIPIFKTLPNFTHHNGKD